MTASAGAGSRGRRYPSADPRRVPDTRATPEQGGPPASPRIRRRCPDGTARESGPLLGGATMRTLLLGVVVLAMGARAGEPAAAGVEAEQRASWTFGAQGRVVGLFAGGYDTSPAFGLAFDVRMELGRLLLDAAAGLLIPSFFHGELDPNLTMGAPFGHLAAAGFRNLHETAAAYLGGGLEVRYQLATGTPGLVPFAEAGVMLWRHGTTRLHVEVRVGQDVLPVTTHTEVSTRSAYPTELGLGLGVGW